MNGPAHEVPAVIGRSGRGGGARPDLLVLGAVAAAAAGIAVRELIGPGSKSVPPGQMVYIGGRTQHVWHRQGARRPTIVFENGLGNPVTMWSWLFDHLPPDTHYLAYDRPGLGWSQPIRGLLSGSRYSQHLLSVLNAVGAPPPYLLVGHSLGGLLIRMFAQHHPELTAGLVFVDAAHPAELLTSSSAGRDGEMLARLDRWIVRAALGMTAADGLTEELASLPPVIAAVTARAMTRVGSLRAARRELQRSREWAASCDSVTSLTPWPVAVVSAATGLANRPGFAGYQNDLAGLSDVSRSYSVAKATHTSLLTEREHAEQVAEAITWALDQTTEPVS